MSMVVFGIVVVNPVSNFLVLILLPYFFMNVRSRWCMQFDELNVEVREFCEARDWGQYHTPKELAIGLVTESSELLELFRFKKRTEQSDLLAEGEKREEVEDELADILFFLLRYADVYDIDLESALERKLEKNRHRYPENEYEGSNKKYDE